MTLYLVRHRQTDWNVEPARCQGWADVPLNQAGRRQARELAATFSDEGIELIVTSHLLRAAQTAEELRDALGAAVGHDIPVTVDRRLAETFRGTWQGRTFASIIATEPETWAAYREHPESFR
ncbi:MAG TPA: histidine phosphatase family protein, partial [Thermoleophilia bacterium]|nr:histidine phosphatase family protein [Thermoleophilia bacterium]